MKITEICVRLVLVILATAMIWHTACVGGAADTQASLPGADTELRSMTGNLANGNASLSAFKTKSLFQTVSSCSTTTLCCYDPDGEPTVAVLDTDCSFSIDIPTENLYYCGFFSGTDADNDSCPDTYLASVGCSESGYGGEIPVYNDTAGAQSDIALGSSNFAGRRLISASDACSQIDQDADGTANSADNDDDGDGTSDSEDNQEGSLARGDADDLDSNNDGIPDIFQSIWDSLTDADDDGIPDYFDVDITCSDIDGDDNGDCVPDSYDICAYDADEDGFNWCLDCDDQDSSTTSQCYYEDDLGFDYCALDNDADGLDICRDCDDENASVTNQCYQSENGNLCDTVDSDADGFSYCSDCNDYDSSSTFECYDTTTDWCSTDGDADGTNLCLDCDDTDSSVTTECYGDYSFCNDDTDGDSVGYCFDCDDQDASVSDDCSNQDYDGDGLSFANDCNDFDDSITSSYSDDADGDGYGACVDCNDSDPSSTYECFGSFDYCSQDNDGDSVSYCEDCNDFDNTVTNVFGTDTDGDGYDSCYDCDDNDDAISFECF